MEYWERRAERERIRERRLARLGRRRIRWLDVVLLAMGLGLGAGLLARYARASLLPMSW